MKYRRYVLFMDNLRVHKANVVKEYLAETGVRIIFNVPYFPQGNPIELVFAQVKREFKTLRTNQIVNGLRQQTVRTVNLSFQEVS